MKTRLAEKLTIKELAKVKASLKKPFLRVKFLGSWRDDHLPCISIEFAGVGFGLWWLTEKAAHAFQYSKDPKAQKLIRSCLKETIRIAEEVKAEEALCATPNVKETTK